MRSHQHEAILDVPADAVYATLTDLERLPDWNGIITAVSERPDRLEPGAEWVVQMRAMGQRWASRSTVVEYQQAERCFRYRSCTDDGNPSWAEWMWTVTPIGDAQCRVAVSWALNPQTFWRRALLARVRARQLRRGELPHSLTRLAEVSAVAARQ
jgi:uncharacterized protein YndB with AHSA1/START domain